jgi:hypothetical protein
MKSSKIQINPIYRDLIIVFSVSLGIAVAAVCIAVMVFSYALQ